MSDHTKLCARLRELSDAVTRGRDGMREFDMRVPVEPERDADVVLSRAADLIERQVARIAELEKTAVRFLWINPFKPVEGAAMPMIPESWRYAFVETDRGLTFGYHDNGPFVAWDAVKDQAARVAELEAEADDSDKLRNRMAQLLTGVANALRGQPPNLTTWSWHDLPERAAAAIHAITVMEAAARDSARMVAELEAAAR